MNLADVTPVVLTLDEEANLGRTLEALRWAPRVLVVDSGSTDRTLEIGAIFENVLTLRRPLDTLAAQWNFARSRIRTPWMLMLDADHVVPGEFAREIEALDVPPETAAFRAAFDYIVAGRALRGTLYPPREVLLHRDRCTFWQDGHAHRVRAEGTIGLLGSRIAHDDRKPFRRFLKRQRGYMRQEAEKLRSTGFRALNVPGRIRKLVVVAPAAVALYTLFVRGLILDGWAGLVYTFERLVAELILSAELLRRRG